MSIEVKSLFTGWHTVTEDQARRFVRVIMEDAAALNKSDRIKYIESERLRGCTVSDLLKEV